MNKEKFSFDYQKCNESLNMTIRGAILPFTFFACLCHIKFHLIIMKLSTNIASFS